MIRGQSQQDAVHDESETAEITPTTSRHLQEPFSYGTVSIGGARSLSFRLALIRDAVWDHVQLLAREEISKGLGVNLIPVGLAVGILLYFAAPAEPSLWAPLSLAIAALVLVSRFQNHGALYYGICAASVVFVGMTAAKISTLRNATPMLERQITAEVEGVVLEVDQNRRGAPRLLIEPYKLEGYAEDDLPRRLRLSAAKGARLVQPGDVVSGLARMQPISGPAHPGSYDFSFHAWFDGLGGSGFFMGAPQVKSASKSISIDSQLEILVNRVRHGINRRIKAVLGEGTGGVAVALVTGDRTGIDEPSKEVLRKTGLAHILAISGLHMALVTLTVIWVIRFAFACFPNIVSTYPVKKWAVLAGCVSATIYLFLSGGSVATQRAWIMLSVMLVAVLLDRRAITMRSVAVSALLILLISPHSLLSPGFQMSFAAVAALVAGYEGINGYRQKRLSTERFEPGGHILVRGLKMTASYFGGLAMTSLIAGTATAFIAGWHFHQVAPLGLLANLVAMPIVALVVMPMILFSVILMPFGFEAVALWPAATGIEWVLTLAGKVQSLSPNGVTGHLPVFSLAIFGSSLSIVTILKTRLRLFGLLGFVFLPFAWSETDTPDVLISENGRAFGLIEDGVLKLPFPRRNQFVTQIWAKAWTGGNQERLELPADQCNRDRCIVVLENSQVLHMVYDPDLIRSSCQRSDILIAPRLWWVRCYDRKPNLVLTRQDFEREGSHALFFEASHNAPVNLAHSELPSPDLGHEQAAHTNRVSSPSIKTGLPQSSRVWSRQIKPIDETNTQRTSSTEGQ